MASEAIRNAFFRSFSFEIWWPNFASEFSRRVRIRIRIRSRIAATAVHSGQYQNTAIPNNGVQSSRSPQTVEGENRISVGTIWHIVASAQKPCKFRGPRIGAFHHVGAQRQGEVLWGFNLKWHIPFCTLLGELTLGVGKLTFELAQAWKS